MMTPFVYSTAENPIRCLPCLVFAAVGLAFSSCVPSRAETLDEAIAAALSRSPSVAAARAFEEVARAEEGIERSGFFPELSTTISMNRERTERLASRNVLNPREADLFLRQPLFNWSMTSARLAAARARTRAASLNRSAETNRVALLAASRYVGVLRSRAVDESVQEYAERVEALATQAQSRVEADPGLRAEFALVQEYVLNARRRMTRVQSALEIASDLYRELTGFPPGELSAPDVASLDVPTSMDEALQRATSSHPLLAAAAARIEEHQQEHRASGGTRLPSVDLKAGYRRERDTDGIKGDRENWYVGVELTYRFATGGRASYDMSAHGHRIDAYTAQRDATLFNLRSAVSEEYSHLTRSRSDVTIAREQVGVSRELIALYEAQFEAGRRPLLDLFYVLRESYRMRLEHIEAQFNVLEASLRLLGAMGILAGHEMSHPPSTSVTR